MMHDVDAPLPSRCHDNESEQLLMLNSHNVGSNLILLNWTFDRSLIGSPIFEFLYIKSLSRVSNMLIMYFNNVNRTIHLTGKGGDSDGKIDLSISVIAKNTITAFISFESFLGLSQYFCNNLFLFGFPSDPFL